MGCALTQPPGFVVTSRSRHGAYPICGDDAFYFNPKTIQNRFHELEVSAPGSGLRDWDVPQS
jgi:hypothetical protein